MGDRLLLVETLNCQDWAQLANSYIAMGEEKAVEGLVERSRRPGSGLPIDCNVRTTLMARLLFVPNGKAPLRTPMLGALTLPYRSMPNQDWPLYPFVKQNEVVFLLSEAYALGGRAESCQEYIEYCQKNGHFRTQPYKVPSFDEAKKALKSLYASGPWKNLQWSFASPSESYQISPSFVTGYLTKQTVPGDY